MFIRQCLRLVKGKRQPYWALVESYRTARGPRQRVVAWLGKLDEAGRLGVQQAAKAPRADVTPGGSAASTRQRKLFDEESSETEPRWVDGYQLTLRMDDGTTQAITQNSDAFHVGERVQVTPGGRVLKHPGR